jgi:hypothetical protein
MASKHHHYIYTIHWRSQKRDHVYSAENSKRICKRIIDERKKRLIQLGYQCWEEDRLGTYTGHRSAIIRKLMFTWEHTGLSPHGDSIILTLVQWDRREKGER